MQKSGKKSQGDTSLFLYLKLSGVVRPKVIYFKGILPDVSMHMDGGKVWK